MKIGSLVKDSVHEIASANVWRTGLIMQVDKDYYGNFNLGKEDRFMVMWNGPDGVEQEYCKTTELEVISEDR